MTPISIDTLDAALNWRYATKSFDATKKIPDATWAALERALILAPSSYGIQPYRFLVIADPKLRVELRNVSWDQSQATDASHYVVFLGRTEITEADVERWITRLMQVRGTPREKLEGYKGMIMGDVVQGPRAAVAADWAARQAYIALGQLMTAAALLGVDACPMEGLDTAEYDRILKLAGTGYKTHVACALGYRAADDVYAGFKKTRLDPAHLLHKV